MNYVSNPEILNTPEAKRILASNLDLAILCTLRVLEASNIKAKAEKEELLDEIFAKATPVQLAEVAKLEKMGCTIRKYRDGRVYVTNKVRACWIDAEGKRQNY